MSRRAFKQFQTSDFLKSTSTTALVKTTLTLSLEQGGGGGGTLSLDKRWGTKIAVICPPAVIIKKAGSDDGLNQGPSMNQSNHLFRILSMNG